MIYFGYFFLYYSFGVEKTNTFIRSRDSLENHTRFKTIMVKIYARFQTKTARKPYPLGRHIPIKLIWGSTSPPPPLGLCRFNFVLRYNIFICSVILWELESFQNYSGIFVHFPKTLGFISFPKILADLFSVPETTFLSYRKDQALNFPYHESSR